MNDTPMDIQCNEFRARVEALLAEGAGTAAGTIQEPLSEHESACVNCRQWRVQTSNLISAVSLLPQYDVSEALTQRILSAVNNEPRHSQSLKALVLGVAVVMVTSFYLITFAMETVEGLVSWFIALAALTLIRILVGLVEPREERTI